MTIPESFEEHFSILYYGPKGSGLHSSFQKLYQLLPENIRGEWEFQEDGETSFWLENYPQKGDQFQLLCVQHPFPEHFPLELTLPKISAIVFVANSESAGLEDNQKALKTLEGYFDQFGIEGEDLCWLYQYNKRDLDEVLPIEKLEETLNENGYPFLETSVPTSQNLKEGFQKIGHMVKERAQSIKNEILQGLSPESSVEMMPAFDPGGVPLMEPEEALQILREKGLLEGVAVEEVDLSSLTFEKPVLIRSCRIGRWKSLGTVFCEKLELRETTFVQEAIFSSPENPLRLEKDCTIAHTHFLGEVNFSGAVALSSVRLLHTEARRGVCSFNRALIHGNLELTDSNFKKGDFRNLLVEGQFRVDPTYFSSATNFQKARFQGECIFTSAVFEGIARFKETRFQSFADFSGADFQDEVYFGDCSFQGVEFFKTCFGGPASFMRSDFRDLARFRRVRFEADSVWTGIRAGKSFLFEDAEFMQTANFQESLFSRLELQNVKFRTEVDFTSSIFEGSVTFHETQFEGDVYFLYCQFQSRADFKGAGFHKGVSFIGMEGNLLALRRSQLEGHLLVEREKSWKETSWEYKRLKKIFEDLQSYGDAEWAYYNFKVAQRKALTTSPYRPDRWARGFFEWLFLDLGAKYGTRPSSLIWASLGLILIFALLYGWVFPQDFSHPFYPKAKINLGSALIVSTSVFATNGPLGWEIFPNSPAAYLVALESLLGLFLILLLVVTFMRKMTH